MLGEEQEGDRGCEETLPEAPAKTSLSTVSHRLGCGRKTILHPKHEEAGIGGLWGTDGNHGNKESQPQSNF